jgi:hypothetical protein
MRKGWAFLQHSGWAGKSKKAFNRRERRDQENAEPRSISPRTASIHFFLCPAEALLRIDELSLLN